MNYQKQAPSRELCEELARIGICQDEPELYWVFVRNTGFYAVSETKVVYRDDLYKSIIAPTLPRMMSELPEDYMVHTDRYDWYVSEELRQGYDSSTWKVWGEDKHLPNAIAKALIAMKKG